MRKDCNSLKSIKFRHISQKVVVTDDDDDDDEDNDDYIDGVDIVCMKVSFQSDGVYLDLVDLVRQDTGFVRVRGGPIAFDRCSDLETSHPISLSTEDASLELQFPFIRSDRSDAGVSSLEFVISSLPAIELTLVTNEPSGLILHSFVSDDLFVALELFEGWLK